jgi:hypothetical protein
MLDCGIFRKTNKAMTKEMILQVVNELPEEVSLDDVVERLILLQSFEQGRQQYQAGTYFTHEEVGTRLEKWLK